MSKYKSAIILFVIYLVYMLLWLLIALNPLEHPGGQDLSPLIPLENAFIESLIMFFVIWLIMPLIGIALSYILTPVFLMIHKKLVGRNLEYGIQDIETPEDRFPLSRSVFPALMAINFSLTLALIEPFQFFVISRDTLESGEFSGIILDTFLLANMFTILVAFLLFIPVWFILDADIVYSNINKSKQTGEPVEAKTVGGWYLILLKGYAGIGVIFAYTSFLIEIISLTLQEGPGLFNFIILLLNFVPFPVLIALASMPCLIFLDMTKPQRNKYTRKWANKLGIVKHVEVQFKEIEK